ncbi:Uncharacterized protein K02A2.6 [Stylophora pistillata]|uniref:Uncharacterized protein K02A2.6 n=1 Tax=Stylophora pistillata TaxID=50429 RepID=A0A2B4R7X0_STYPI|nr:Uncharacterized protein K02A2.6 [Stylophora pistillata]
MPGRGGSDETTSGAVGGSVNGSGMASVALDSNIPFERHLLRQISQDSGETVDQFVCRLRQRAATCEFGINEDDYILDQLIDKCYSSHLHRKFLEKEGTVTLGDLLRVARSQEAVDRQLKQYNTDQVDRVNAVRGKVDGDKNPRKLKTCFSCGREVHFIQDWRCLARGQTCGKMRYDKPFQSQMPHLIQRGGAQSGFKGTRNSRGEHGRGGRGAGGFGRGGRGRGRGGLGQEANLVTRRPALREEDKKDFARPGRQSRPDYAFSVEQLDDHREERSALVTLIIGGVYVPDVLIDSGASCNVMGQRTWELLKQKGIKCESRKSAKEIFAYGGVEPLSTLGTFTADVTHAGCEFKDGSKAEFIVVEGDGRTLLGRETAEVLNLLRVGPFQANSVDGGRPDGSIRGKYKELFSGVGLLKGYELKLHVDESVKPVAQHVRRIPFGLREKVDAKLDELLRLDIIEEVPEGPSGWISPLVVVPKGDGDVRVCVDMRRANEAIVRERHPIPTVEELLHDLNGSTMFSKIDLKWGFHQILLSEESRHITTFVTHRGLYRYKRLMFGVTSAPEKYQQIIRDVLRAINKMASIAIMIGGALINATAFVGGSYLAKYLSGDKNSVEEEKKRHDLAVEKYQAAYEKYQENRTKLLDWISANDRIKKEANQNFVDTDYALKLYNKAHSEELDMKEPHFSNFYKPSTQQKQVRDGVDSLKFSTVKGGMFPNQICDFIESNFPQSVREKERREIDWRHNVSCTLSRMKCFDNGEYGRTVIRPDHLRKFTKDNKVLEKKRKQRAKRTRPYKLKQKTPASSSTTRNGCRPHVCKDRPNEHSG